MNKEVEIFENYIKSFNLNIPELNGKYNHTFRVSQYAEEIAKSINLDEKEINRAKICALFHDLGRFPQFSEYKTFIDDKSFDHGDKSEEILRNLEYDDDVVLNAVKYHNKKDVPAFDELTSIHSNIVRDADKLDIMDTQVNELDRYDYEYPTDIMDCFKNHTLLNNHYADSKFINLIRMLCFIFDINYEESIRILIKKNIINRKLELLRKNINNKEVDLIEKEIKNYIKERFDIIC